MEIPRDVWMWLVKLKAVASVRASKQPNANGMVSIDQQAMAELESGISMAKALGQLDRRYAKHLDAIKNNAASPVARLANWTLLEKTLKSGFSLGMFSLYIIIQQKIIRYRFFFFFLINFSLFLLFLYFYILFHNSNNFTEYTNNCSNRSQ